ncbi:hypothetical protein BU24DRAFT_496151 [Aaosphaeria arxii CBS 175.79]|uniref:Uncharacterized protein n=1 Tax=Aaosphaeria arxii CBS 175.79 TaxID=1450172 RepID=A0A6A5XDS3_9PLEO|nr:uncharacterized protein BU24DRAFT_496151 [Aaosphaeria arxii CBS 175.79]KAF2011001.1 hypothetical protein BU24DRAFT_496151 [Aaosphaeria arxii CBS 175.79]
MEQPGQMTSSQRITRSLVQAYLRDPDDGEEDVVETPSDSDLINSKNFEEHAVAVCKPVDPSFAATREYLNDLIHEESSSLDWSLDYTSNPRAVSPDGNGISGLSINTGILTPIRLGLGPRVAKECSDALLLLCKKGADEQSESTQPCTYPQMLEKLLALSHESMTQRCDDEADCSAKYEELLDALNQRIRELAHLIETAEFEEDPSDARAVQAVRAYCPETAVFAGQDLYHLLVNLTVNHTIVRPTLTGGVGGLLWDTVFKTMLMETLYSLEKKFHEEKRSSLKTESNSARVERDPGNSNRLEKGLAGVNKKSVPKAATMVIDDLKRGRKGLWKKELDSLQELAAAQTGQKWHLNLLLAHPPLHLLQQICEEADLRLVKTLRKQIGELEDEQVVVHTIGEVLQGLGTRNLRRVRRFAALDVPEERRDQVLRERMDNPLTSIMMMGVIGENQSVQNTSNVLRRRVTDMENVLQEILEATKCRFQACDDMYNWLGSDEAMEDVLSSGN